MSARPSDRARAAAAAIWEAQHAHPFVRGLADGTVPLDALARWVRQDYLFLKDYVRVLALAAAKAPDLATIGRFAALAHETATTEMDLHRAYARDFGISPEELEAEEPAPATHAYADFLVRTASHEAYPALVAALLPCMWGFSEIGRRLAEGPRPADPRHAAWIDMYASDEFAALATWAREAYDAVATDAEIPVFVASSRHELAFWDAAWPAAPQEGPA